MARKVKLTNAQRNALAWYAGIGPQTYVQQLTKDVLIQKGAIVLGRPPFFAPEMTDKGRQTLQTGYWE